jgi:hypothetical protein
MIRERDSCTGSSLYYSKRTRLLFPSIKAMEFLIYGESEEEINIQQIKEKVVEPLQLEEIPVEVAIPEVKILDPLEEEIHELLKESSPEVLEQYKNMESAIRNVYQEISALDLPLVNLQTNTSKPHSEDAEVRTASKVIWDPKASIEKKRINFLSRHGVELPSAVYHARKILIPDAVSNQRYDQRYLKLGKVYNSELELFSPKATGIPDIRANSPTAKRFWRPKTAPIIKRILFQEGKKSLGGEGLPVIENKTESPLKQKLRKRKKKRYQEIN